MTKEVYKHATEVESIRDAISTVSNIEATIGLDALDILDSFKILNY